MFIDYIRKLKNSAPRLESLILLVAHLSFLEAYSNFLPEGELFLWCRSMMHISLHSSSRRGSESDGLDRSITGAASCIYILIGNEARIAGHQLEETRYITERGVRRWSQTKESLVVDELSCVTRQDCALTRGDGDEDGGVSVAVLLVVNAPEICTTQLRSSEG